MSSSDGGGIRLKVSQGHRVVVVGGGLAGLTASLEAIEHGAHVTLVEGEARVGGNSAKATRCVAVASLAWEGGLDCAERLLL